ncbi:hypothetical protein FQA39_LY13133 [Lamprigera yunnana]|nr:hypothetical protein FQA39_LY13133 [Lamprigera yunnana]
MALYSKFTKDSVNRVAVFLYLYLIVMTSNIMNSHSLPISSGLEVKTPWWCKPCHTEHRTRHSRAINEELRTQFAVAKSNFGTMILPYLNQIHAKVGNVTKKQLTKIKWLPRKKFFQLLKKNNEKILPELLYQIEVYLLTIDKLSQMEIRTHDGFFNPKERDGIMERLKCDLMLLQGETIQQIAEKRQKITKKVPLNLVDKKIPKVVNHLVEGLIKDYSIIMKYSDFIDKCYNKIFEHPKSERAINSDKPKRRRKVKKVTKTNTS